MEADPLDLAREVGLDYLVEVQNSNSVDVPSAFPMACLAPPGLDSSSPSRGEKVCARGTARPRASSLLRRTENERRTESERRTENEIGYFDPGGSGFGSLSGRLLVSGQVSREIDKHGGALPCRRLNRCYRQGRGGQA